MVPPELLLMTNKLSSTPSELLIMIPLLLMKLKLVSSFELVMVPLLVMGLKLLKNPVE